MLPLFILIFVGILFTDTSYAFEVVPTQITYVGAQHNIWKPSGAVVIKEGVACARAHQESCGECLHETTAICTFDGGESFSIQQTRYPFCGDQGVVVNGTLFCPLNTQRVNTSVINVTLVSYEGSNSLVETERNNTVLSFNYWPGEEIVDIEFKGNTIFFSNDRVYIMNAIVRRGNSSSEHVLFSSTNGFLWNVRSRIPMDVTDRSALTRNGKTRVTVSSFTPGYHQIISSFYKGTQWGSSKYLSTSLPPAALVLESGIVVESGLSNHSSALELSMSVEGMSRTKSLSLIDFYKEKTNSNLFLQDVTTECKDDTACLTSSFVALMSLRPGYVTALFDFTSAESQRKTVAAITMEVDDSQERKEMLDAIKKTEEEAKLREELWKKIQQENEERKRKELQEKRRKEKERKERFMKMDVVNIEAAKARIMEDGEMIVVRDVVEDMVDIEKQVFFW